MNIWGRGDELHHSYAVALERITPIMRCINHRKKLSRGSHRVGFSVFRVFREECFREESILLVYCFRFYKNQRCSGLDVIREHT
jgi:hypothetical protein